MVITIKKSILPTSIRDIESSLKAINALERESGIARGENYNGFSFDYGFELLIRYGDLSQLDKIGENLKMLQGYPLSLHAPLNPSSPEKVDVSSKEGVEILARLADFSDKNQISLAVTHPNALRNEKDILSLTPQKRAAIYNSLIKNIFGLNKTHKCTIALENKPNPSTDISGEGILYAPIASSFQGLKDIGSKGIPLVFDTAHYAISHATISSGLAESSRCLPLPGFFESDYQEQPSIREALSNLASSIIEIHHNDSAPNKKIGEYLTYHEALVPGEGKMVSNRDIIPFLKSQKQMSVVLEVNESDYVRCTNFQVAGMNFFRDFFSD